MQPYDQMLSLKKCVWFFLDNPKELFFLGVIMGVKRKLKIKKHNVIHNHVWLWERTNTLDMQSSLVVVCCFVTCLLES